MLMILAKAEEVKLVWERHDEFNYRQAICYCSDIPGSAVRQTV